MDEMLDKEAWCVEFIALFALQALAVLDKLLIFYLFFDLFLEDRASFHRLIDCIRENLIVSNDFGYLRLIKN
jgi:hypothetical protein